MIFCGDIALPYSGCIDYSSIPIELRNKYWFGNLEGSLLKNSSSYLSKKVVFNDYEAISELCGKITFKGVGLANNHLLDAYSFENSRVLLSNLDVAFGGAGNSIHQAEQPVFIQDEYGQEFVILAFGWNVIECVYASTNREGVNPYQKKHVFSLVKKIVSTYPNKKIICFFHWNYELELYPQPYDRVLAKELIDLGVYAIIGCHAHRVQQIEFYKGHPIVYGLGNFLFPQNIYWNGKLKFPECSYNELLFEILPNDVFCIHRLHYNPLIQKINYISSNNIHLSSELKENATFNNLSVEVYEKWFTSNRYQKKILPVFRSVDSDFVYEIKSLCVILRGELINALKYVLRK